MRIAFVGDSYCAGNLPSSWTTLVADRLGAEIACLGRGGSSIGQAYFDLMEHLDGSDLFLMFYTEGHRLYNPHLYPINSGMVSHYGRHGIRKADGIDIAAWPDSGVWDAAVAYYDRLYHEPYHELLHGLIINRCDRVLADHISRHPRKRALHFHSFLPPGGIRPMASGATCREDMRGMIARRVALSSDLSGEEQNHMRTEGNRLFAEAVLAVIGSDHGQWFDIP